jgi:hypothetical protein
MKDYFYHTSMDYVATRHAWVMEAIPSVTEGL